MRLLKFFKALEFDVLVMCSHNITEILLNVTLNTISLVNNVIDWCVTSMPEMELRF